MTYFFQNGAGSFKNDVMMGRQTHYISAKKQPGKSGSLPVRNVRRQTHHEKAAALAMFSITGAAAFSFRILFQSDAAVCRHRKRGHGISPPAVPHTLIPFCFSFSFIRSSSSISIFSLAENDSLRSLSSLFSLTSFSFSLITFSFSFCIISCSR